MCPLEVKLKACRSALLRGPEHKNDLWNRDRLTDIDSRLVVAKGEGSGEGMEWEFRVRKCKLLYINWIKKIILCSTGNYIQYPVICHNGRENEKKYRCVTESLCYIAEINTTL